MDIGRTLRRQLQSMLGPTIGLSLSAYFGYHLIEGDRGLYAWVNMTRQIQQAEGQASTIRASRDGLERRVAMLRPEHVDPDILDEQARAALNLASPGDVVILLPSADGR